MNDVREAMERVGARFDPPGGGLDDLTRRRKRARRRRLTAGMLALAVGAGALLAVQTFQASTPGQPSKIRVLATWAAASAATPHRGCLQRADLPHPLRRGSPSGGPLINLRGCRLVDRGLWEVRNRGALDADLVERR